MSRARSALLVLPVLAGCGLDGIFLTPRGFDPTDPPRTVLATRADPGATLEVMSKAGAIIARGTAPDGGEIELPLPPEEEGTNLRVIARKGGRAFKAIVAAAPRGAITEIALDNESTALAQLATYEITSEAGSSFGATPTPALRGLVQVMTASPTPELGALVALIGEIETKAPDEDGVAPAFELGGWALSEELVRAARLPADTLTRYRNALARAAQGFGLEIRCDPSRLNAMFAVDASGRARDGNGAPQLIRQPVKAGRVFLGFTSDESSPVADESLPKKLTPNDPTYAMTDDGQNGDEHAGDGIYTVVVALPKGARLLYKYTNGAAGEGFTGTEEWPGNARIIEVQDVLTGRPDGEPDCLIVRRDSFGDEATNKNFVNLSSEAKKRGGTVGFETDLGGAEVPLGRTGARLGGLDREALRRGPALTPAGVPEARENGVCTVCPPPLILDPDDASAPELLGAERVSTTRIRARFSEPIRSEDARDLGRFLYVGEAGSAIAVISTRASGSDVMLETAPAHPTNPARLRVKNLRDASARGNLLSSAEVEVGPDKVAPKLVAATAASLLDVTPGSRVDDPTRGEIIHVVLDELPEASAASDPSRFAIEGLEVRAAAIVAGAPVPTVRLVTAPHEKGRQYVLKIRDLRDSAGNALEQETRFEGFALYKVSFGVVPGFAFADSTGRMRGVPRGEKLYLTGTPLAAARDLAGRDISIAASGGGAVRTDVTGWPQFEMKASTMLYKDQPIYRIELLLPKGSWAWKAAHGVEGEHVRAPTTLEKVYKTLVTANDATGVRIDPSTPDLRADNGRTYAGAALSESGEEPPRPTVIFKREAPDEVCEVTNRDADCPYIVIGAWRDLVLDQGGKTRDYDDGIIALPPHRPLLPDFSPPKLLDARARDSYSILLSFDEAIAAPHRTLEVQLAKAEDGTGVPIGVLETTEVKPHQAVLRIPAASGKRLEDGVAYTLRYRGATDVARTPHTDRAHRTRAVLAPDRLVPFQPLTDEVAPSLLSVQATDLTELFLRFDETIDPSTARASAFRVTQRTSGADLQVESAELLADRQSMRLVTARQAILEPYRLTVSGIADVAERANVLTSTTIDFTGFGERTPAEIRRVRAVGPRTVLVRFDEPVDPTSAREAAKYMIDGLSVQGATFAGDPARRALAFNARLAPALRDAVLLETSPMTAGTSYTLRVQGVADLSGNLTTASASFIGADAAPVVDVVLEVNASDSIRVAGRVPSRAISADEVASTREGVFVLGGRAREDGSPVPGLEGPVNDVLRGFPPEGQPLDGIEPRLKDDGAAPDRVAGDGVFTILLPRVPLGTTILWKAFAPYTTTYRDQNPTDSAAAFADALPGPSVFADGQEFPGNENGAIILDEGATQGTVRLGALFGDEITYKKNTGRPAYFWLYEDR